MGRLKYLLALLPALLLGAGRSDYLRSYTVLATDQVQQVGATPLGSVPKAAVGPGRGVGAGIPGAIVGTQDTIGGTTYDWQVNGPSQRWVVDAAGSGVHAVWMYSADHTSSFSDRNMRYNFDSGAGSWVWHNLDFMQSGVSVFASRCGYGNVDADPTTGVAVVSGHMGTGSPYTPTLARDEYVGTGIFSWFPGPVGYMWPCISVGQNSIAHCQMFEDMVQDTAYYSRVTTGGTWTSPVLVAPTQAPEFPTHNVAASKASGKVCLTWTREGNPLTPAYYRISSNSGGSWGSPTELMPPSAYGTDTTTTFTVHSLFPFYDQSDKLHIVATVLPVVRDTTWILPAQIWLWCPNNTPNWSRIATATADPSNLLGSVGSNAAFACRPTIGEGDDGELVVAWEQFDSTNYEPATGYLRADIWGARSIDNGVTWGEPVRITSPDGTSKRFPCVVDKIASDGTCRILYEIDQQAGSFVMGQGTATDNPVVVHRVPKTTFPAPGGQAPGAFNLSMPSNNATGIAVAGSLAWGAASGATNYDVYLGTSSPPPLYAGDVGNVATYPYSGLSNSTRYYWAVVAKNTYGSTRCNSDFHFTTAAPGSPGAFNLLTPVDDAVGIAVAGNLTWGAASGATNYDVYLGTSSPPPLYAGDVGNVTTCPYTGLSENTVYYWAVVAKNVGGSTRCNADFSFTTVAPGSPGAFRLLSPPNGATDQSTSGMLTWQVSSAAISYDVYLGSTSPPSLAANVTDTGYAYSGLSASQGYYWYVVAKNDSGSTQSDSVFTFGTAAAPPPALAISNYPNPFEQATTFLFVLPDQASVSLSIFDAAGTCVRHLLRNQPLAAGTQTLAWDATNDAGRRVSLGNYHYLLEYSAASAQRVVGKLVVSKEKQP